ncbi:hypothetical protein C7999DRAFT_29203 [Corynascus novoguineensis]|uniref:U4/U6.U5 small nuclear ribonucleoprotein 27kDa protein domain-containing protein n=1 Tax=Corynascus novoguineensis TaxID=1126955 RepID=A0AAN7D0C0_9PEZI|nr:hypothetical protein C7999DRAFT_29203 [Corynascus novoguineensis]
MADRRDGEPRRGGERPFHDNRDRRRDRDERRQNSARDHGRDRDRDRDHRRYRSRSRDRGDRRRSRSPGRERGYDRRDADRERDRDRARGHRRREDDRTEPPRARGDRSEKGDFDRADRGNFSHVAPSPASSTTKATTNPGQPPRDRNGRSITASPRRSASPRRPADKDSDGHSQLPTRSKPNGSTSGAAPVPAAPVSFKVKGRDGSHGPEPRQQSTSTRENSQEHQQQHEDGERQQSRGRFDAEPMDEDEVEDVIVEDDGLDDMAAMMGFGGFGTTKGKKVLGNNVGAARKEKKTQYRQYMNRVGGFNRPLSPTR